MTQCSYRSHLVVSAEGRLLWIAQSRAYRSYRDYRDEALRCIQAERWAIDEHSQASEAFRAGAFAALQYLVARQLPRCYQPKAVYVALRVQCELALSLEPHE